MFRRPIALLSLLLGGPLMRFPAGQAVWKNAVVAAAAVGGLFALLPRIRNR